VREDRGTVWVRKEAYRITVIRSVRGQSCIIALIALGLTRSAIFQIMTIQPVHDPLRLRSRHVYIPPSFAKLLPAFVHCLGDGLVRLQNRTEFSMTAGQEMMIKWAKLKITSREILPQQACLLSLFIPTRQRLSSWTAQWTLKSTFTSMNPKVHLKLK